MASGSDIDDFALETVALRAEVDPVRIKQIWPNTPDLFTAALLDWGEKNIPIPDTGTLRSDLTEYSRSFATAVNSPIGRRLLDAVVISPKDWDTYGSRKEFRKARPNRNAVMVQRAIDRGECSSNVDPGLVVELLATALSTPILFYDRPISEEFCASVVELFLNGVLHQ